MFSKYIKIPNIWDTFERQFLPSRALKNRPIWSHCIHRLEIKFQKLYLLHDLEDWTNYLLKIFLLYLDETRPISQTLSYFSLSLILILILFLPISLIISNSLHLTSFNLCPFLIIFTSISLSNHFFRFLSFERNTICMT